MLFLTFNDVILILVLPLFAETEMEGEEFKRFGTEMLGFITDYLEGIRER